MLLVSRPVSSEDDNVRAGILWMLVTTLLFVSLDATAKYLVAGFPVLQVVWARFLFHFLFATFALGPRLPSLVRTASLKLQLLRSLLILVTTGLFFTGVRLLPLADASAIMFLSPIFLSILAIPLLGETVGPRRWAAIAVGFVGALIVVRPGSGVMDLGALVLLGCACSNSLYQLITRKIRGRDDPRTTLFYTAIVGALVTSLMVPAVWRTPGLEDWLLMVLMGGFGCVSHFTLIKAFQRAPAAVVAPFSYAGLVWAILLGFLVFGDLPDLWTVTGAGIIACGGLYILHREQALKAEGVRVAAARAAAAERTGGR